MNRKTGKSSSKGNARSGSSKIKANYYSKLVTCQTAVNRTGTNECRCNLSRDRTTERNSKKKETIPNSISTTDVPSQVAKSLRPTFSASKMPKFSNNHNKKKTQSKVRLNPAQVPSGSKVPTHRPIRNDKSNIDISIQSRSKETTTSEEVANMSPNPSGINNANVSSFPNVNLHIQDKKPNISIQSPSSTTVQLPDNLKQFSRNKEMLDPKYLQFILRITEDIIRFNVIKQEEVHDIIKKHLESNYGILQQDSMMRQISTLLRDLNMSSVVFTDKTNSSTTTNNMSSAPSEPNNEEEIATKGFSFMNIDYGKGSECVLEKRSIARSPNFDNHSPPPINQNVQFGCDDGDTNEEILSLNGFKEKIDKILEEVKEAEKSKKEADDKDEEEQILNDLQFGSDDVSLLKPNNSPREKVTNLNEVKEKINKIMSGIEEKVVDKQEMGVEDHQESIQIQGEQLDSAATEPSKSSATEKRRSTMTLSLDIYDINAKGISVPSQTVIQDGNPAGHEFETVLEVVEEELHTPSRITQEIESLKAFTPEKKAVQDSTLTQLVSETNQFKAEFPDQNAIKDPTSQSIPETGPIKELSPAKNVIKDYTSPLIPEIKPLSAEKNAANDYCSRLKEEIEPVKSTSPEENAVKSSTSPLMPEIEPVKSPSPEKNAANVDFVDDIPEFIIPVTPVSTVSTFFNPNGNEPIKESHCLCGTHSYIGQLQAKDAHIRPECCHFSKIPDGENFEKMVQRIVTQTLELLNKEPTKACVNPQCQRLNLCCPHAYKREVAVCSDTICPTEAENCVCNREMVVENFNFLDTVKESQVENINLSAIEDLGLETTRNLTHVINKDATSEFTVNYRDSNALATHQDAAIQIQTILKTVDSGCGTESSVFFMLDNENLRSQGFLKDQSSEVRREEFEKPKVKLPVATRPRTSEERRVSISDKIRKYSASPSSAFSSTKLAGEIKQEIEKILITVTSQKSENEVELQNILEEKPPLDSLEPLLEIKPEQFPSDSDIQETPSAEKKLSATTVDMLARLDARPSINVSPSLELQLTNIQKDLERYREYNHPGKIMQTAVQIPPNSMDQAVSAEIFSVVQETENHTESTENRSSDTNDVVTKKRSIRFDSKWRKDPVAINHQNFRPPIHYVPKVDMSSSLIISSGHPSAAASDGTKSESQGPNADEFAQKVSKMSRNSRNSMSRNSIKNFFTLYRTDPKKFS